MIGKKQKSIFAEMKLKSSNHSTNFSKSHPTSDLSSNSLTWSFVCIFNGSFKELGKGIPKHMDKNELNSLNYLSPSKEVIFISGRCSNVPSSISPVRKHVVLLHASCHRPSSVLTICMHSSETMLEIWQAFQLFLCSRHMSASSGDKFAHPTHFMT